MMQESANVRRFNAKQMFRVSIGTTTQHKTEEVQLQLVKLQMISFFAVMLILLTSTDTFLHPTAQVEDETTRNREIF